MAAKHATPPLSRQHMPDDFGISLDSYTRNRQVRIPDDFGPAQSLSGFDPDYRNIVDYIVRITYRIWETEQRDVDYIANCYASDSRVFDDYGLQLGNQKIIVDTRHTTGAFPDVELDAEEIIWAGDDQIGFHTSHLTRITGTNSGPSRYGEAKNAVISVPVIANCVALDNDIFLEHVLYNTSAMLKQLGLDLWDEAAKYVANPPAGWPRSQLVWDELRSAASPSRPLSAVEPVDGFDPDIFARHVHAQVWSGKHSTLTDFYQRDFPFEGTTERAFDGVTAYREYINEILSAFPDIDHQVDEVYWMGNEVQGWLISTRWSAEGTHGGDGVFGAPTHSRCQIWGITQWRVKDRKVEQEWQLFNEFDVMMQVVNGRNNAS